MDNPQAFPMPAAEHSQGGHFEQHGMTLRDYFAGQVASTALAWAIDECDEDHPVTAAKLAYQFADAMLAERAKVQA